MRTCQQVSAALFLSLALVASVTPRYVDLNSPSPTPPYLTWTTAATNIQDAVDIAVAGDLVLVTNGVYRTGGRAVVGAMTNRVAVDKPLMVQSVNGSKFTEIWGYQLPGTINGDGAIRCVYLTDGASLSGFKLTKGATRLAGNEHYERYGGGVWCEPSAVVSNCVIAGNSASSYGGGVLSGTLYNCALSGNLADAGGGASGDPWQGRRVQLNNCTLIGNSARIFGGVQSGAMNNCIIYFNNAQESFPNYSSSDADVITYSCATPLPSSGAGNIDLDPQMSDESHLSSNSPCRGTGSDTYASGADIDGEPWASPPSMGCDEYFAGTVPGALSVSFTPSYTNVAAGFTVDLVAQIEGIATSSFWDFGDGVLVTNGPHSGRLFVSHAWATPNDYEPVLRVYNNSHLGGVSATQIVHVIAPTVHYVVPNSATPTPPYTSWLTAATTIQDAIDAASTVPGTWVLVTNGLYATGGRAVGTSLLLNRVVVDKPLTLRSVNGPELTIIQGYQVPGKTNGDGAIRCLYLTNGASLFGFTLTKGATRDPYWDGTYTENSGGGIWCATADVLISNCVLVANSAYGYGGGVYQGTLLNCTITNNTATKAGESGGGGGGAASSTLLNCTIARNSAAFAGGGVLHCPSTNCLVISNAAGFNGGGAAYGTLVNCQLRGNLAGYASATDPFGYSGAGGGSFSSSVINSLVVSNSAIGRNGNGGGINWGEVINCTVVGNSAVVDGGISDGRVTNCIIYFNKATTSPNYEDKLWEPLNHCCTTPMPNYGVGNIMNSPDFLNLTGGDFRLQSNSPCINAGNNAYAPAGPDLDGNPRIVAGTVDMGAYECQSPALLDYYTWLQGFGLPTSAAAIYADSDGEGMNNWQEWRADTIPTNALSVLQMTTLTNDPPGLQVTWQSVPTRTYWLERATNLASPPSFSSVASNLTGQVGMTTYTDTNATGLGPFFYRVGVQP